jgi:hypothetical protein
MESTSTVGAPFAPDNDLEQPTTEVHASLLSRGAGKQCAVCSAPLAPDQRYCLECGERNGDPRLPIMERGARPMPVEAPAARGYRKLRLSPSGTLIAGIATLLLAMGVGVLIGRGGGDSNGKSGQVQVVTVPSGSGAAAAGTAAAATQAATTSAKHKKTAAKRKTAASTTASSLPKNKKKLPPPVVKVGSPGHGAGYQNGKFTGNFFGN